MEKFINLFNKEIGARIFLTLGILVFIIVLLLIFYK